MLLCKRLLWLTLGTLSTTCVQVHPQGPVEPAESQSRYPAARRTHLAETRHGVTVEDPYRWLEAMESEETKAWVEAQNSLTRDYLGSIPERDRIYRKILKLSRFSTFTRPIKAGDRYFYVETPPEGVGVLVVQEGKDGKPRRLIDPNLTHPDGSASLGLIAPSRDGTSLVYSAGAGSLWLEARILDVRTRTHLQETLVGMTWASSVAWATHNKGFYYMRFDQPKAGSELTSTPVNSRVMYHQLGTPQSQDRLIYRRPDQAKWMLSPLRTSEDGRYLIMAASGDSAAGNGLFYVDLQDPERRVSRLIPVGEESHTLVGSAGERVWITTTQDAPNGRLVEIDISRPDPKLWKTVIPERTDAPLVSATSVGDRFVCWYTEDVKPRLRVFDQEGYHVDDISLPATTGYLRNRSIRGTRGDPELFFDFASTAHPSALYLYDSVRKETATVRRPEGLPWDPAEIVIRQVFYSGRDQTRLPMFLILNRKTSLKEPRLTYMPGYGAGGWIMNTGSSPLSIFITMLDGVVAIPGLRGGGEYGIEWHKAGSGRRKQNTFDDYLAAAEWLIQKGYTKPDRLIAQGLSAGGVIPAVAANQRPDLFGMIWSQWPVTEMLRFTKFTGGNYWTGEYGNPSNPDDFRALLRYSPYHNVKADQCYPAAFVMAGEKDQSAVPMHAYKYVAALQHAQKCDKPILLDVVEEGGHLPTASQYPNHAADWLAFAARVLDLDLSRALADTP